MHSYAMNYLEAIFKLCGLASLACDNHAQAVPHGCQTLHHDSIIFL